MDGMSMRLKEQRETREQELSGTKSKLEGFAQLHCRNTLLGSNNEIRQTLYINVNYQIIGHLRPQSTSRVDDSPRVTLGQACVYFQAWM